MDTHLLHSFNVFTGKLDDVYVELPTWKKKVLEDKLIELWAVLEAKERRGGKERRKV